MTHANPTISATKSKHHGSPSAMTSSAATGAGSSAPTAMSTQRCGDQLGAGMHFVYWTYGAVTLGLLHRGESHAAGKTAAVEDVHIDGLAPDERSRRLHVDGDRGRIARPKRR